MSGCFDSYVNSDIASIKEVFERYTDIYDRNDVYLALDATEYALAAICFGNLVLTFYLICSHKSLGLLGNFCQLDNMIPSVKFVKPKGIFD